VELVQAVNADLNRLGVVVGNTIDVFGAAHDVLNSPLEARLQQISVSKGACGS